MGLVFYDLLYLHLHLSFDFSLSILQFGLVDFLKFMISVSGFLPFF